MNLLASSVGRRWLFALLYLSEGAPIGFVWWALPTLLRNMGVELTAITTLTSLATLPWVLKFLIAPAIDAGLYRAIPLKRWILVCQFCMAISLLPLMLVDWIAQYSLVMAIIVAHATFAAVQDVGIDTLAIRSVPADELGRINGWMQAGMLVGRAGVAAGTALIAGSLGGVPMAVLLLALLIVLPALALLLAAKEPPSRLQPMRPGAVVRTVVTRVGVAGLLVALLIGAGFEYFGVSAGPRLVDLSYSDADLALFYGLLAPAGLALGALAGGTLTDRIGALGGTAASLFVLTGLLAWIAAQDLFPVIFSNHLLWYPLAYGGIGMLTASSYALFMALSRGAFAATRISLFMAMTNACEAWAAFLGGRLSVQGYGMSLLILTAAACLAILPLLVLWRELGGISWRGMAQARR